MFERRYRSKLRELRARIFRMRSSVASQRRWYMRSLNICFAILFGVGCLHAQKSRFGEELPFPKKDVDYSLKIHVSGIRESTSCPAGTCLSTLAVTVLVGGKKLELQCPSWVPEKPGDWIPFALGDTRGRVLPKYSGYELADQYELLTRNGHVAKCRVSGIFE
jgi:hypothetical protein